MNTSVKNIALAAIIAGAVLLSGCALSPEVPGTDAKPQPTETQPAEASATEAPVDETPASPVRDPVAGDTIDADTAAELKAERGNVRPYELADGNIVAVETNKPLPKAVREDIVAEIIAKKAVGPQTMEGDPNLRNAQSELATSRLAGIANSLRMDTGKEVVVVLKTATSNDVGNLIAWVAGSTNKAFHKANASGRYVSTSKDTMVAMAKDFIASQKDAKSWELIVVD